MSGYISANNKYTNYTASNPGSAPNPGTPNSGGSVEPVAPTKADQVISIAQSYIGQVSYVFGVRNPDKLIFDCSSFTQFVFAEVGVTLKWGTKLSAIGWTSR